MKLYGYWRSSASYRVRITLALKGLDYEEESIDLRLGAQHEPAYRALNPQGRVPTLVDGNLRLSQSLAILEYLEELHPSPALLPTDAPGRARVRQLCQAVACDVHPLQNLAVLAYLTAELGVSDERRLAWYRHWVERGLAELEKLLAGHPHTGTYCHGDTPTLADACLVPQLYNARRFDCDLSVCPEIVRIDAACLALEAFASALPERQADAP